MLFYVKNISWDQLVYFEVYICNDLMKCNYKKKRNNYLYVKEFDFFIFQKKVLVINLICEFIVC